MPSYQDLLAEVKSQINEISAADAAARLSSDEPPVLIDVREPDEFDQGAIEGAIAVPRGNLELRIGALVPDRSTPIVISCQSGARSAFAARSLEELGYEDVSSLAGGFGGWKQNGFPWSAPRVLSEAQRARYSRHLLLPEVGEAGQLKLLDVDGAALGAGGLGSPAGLYLAAAGVGTIGSGRRRRGRRVESAAPGAALDGLASACPRSSRAEQTLEELNPDVNVIKFQERLNSSENIDRILEDGWDVIVDGIDNFPTRYLLNDASVCHHIPVVHGVDLPLRGPGHDLRAVRGPCYRCLFPEPPPAHLAPSCAEAGVLGVLPGIIGSLQATEAIKLLLGRAIRSSVACSVRLAEMSFRDATGCAATRSCPVCGDAPPITEYIDYEELLPASRAGDDLRWRASDFLQSCGRWPEAPGPSRPAVTACVQRWTTSPTSTPHCVRACSTTTARSLPS